MQTSFPDYVTKTLNILNAAGYEAYVVGGAVRDLLLGLEPGDYDIATNGRPEQIAAVLRNAGYLLAEKLGENFGVVVAVTEGRSLEIASFRNERYAYGQDAHRPAEVWFCDTLKEDLSRRDFTVNAMAMDSRGKLYDYYGGQKDLEAKVIRTVGDPRKRFAEDALRMYRACRFVAQLDFTYVEGSANLFSFYSLVIIVPSIIGAACFPIVFKWTHNKGWTAAIFSALTGITMIMLYFFSPNGSAVPFYIFAALSQFFFSGFNTAHHPRLRGIWRVEDRYPKRRFPVCVRIVG